MTTFTTEEMKVLKALVVRLQYSFVDPLFDSAHPMFNQRKERRRLLKKLGIKNG